jgi:hypothetical protein
MSNPCGTLVVTEQCRVSVLDNSIGAKLSKNAIGATIRDRSILEPGEGFQIYILTDLDEFIVDELAQYLIG